MDTLIKEFDIVNGKPLLPLIIKSRNKEITQYFKLDTGAMHTIGGMNFARKLGVDINTLKTTHPNNKWRFRYSDGETGEAYYSPFDIRIVGKHFNLSFTLNIGFCDKYKGTRPLLGIDVLYETTKVIRYLRTMKFDDQNIKISIYDKKFSIFCDY